MSRQAKRAGAGTDSSVALMPTDGSMATLSSPRNLSNKIEFATILSEGFREATGSKVNIDRISSPTLAASIQ